MKQIIILILAIAFAIFFTRKCQGEKIVTVTETEYILKTDTINTVEIKKVPYPKYITKIKTIDGKDSIVYVDKKTRQAIKVNEFEAVVKTDSSRADLIITSTGEVLQVKGTITYNQKNTVTTITKTRPMSGLFLYGQTSLDFQDVGIGLDYQFKNKIILGASVNYNQIIDSPTVLLKVGIRIW